MEYISSKTILSTYKENLDWFGINYNINIYKGCCHGCIYCDSRSNCYQIIDFDRIRIKKNSTEMLKNELRSKRVKGVVGTGAMSDPYNPFEEKYMLTREALELVNENKFGISIATKSSLVTRDIDILKEIQKHSPTIVKITITTYDDDLCKKIERNVNSTSERFRAIKKLSDNGIYTGVLMMPLLPYINDDVENIRNIIKTAYECGAKFVYTHYFGVTLRQNQREYYFQQLKKDFSNVDLEKLYNETHGNVYENKVIDYEYKWNVFKDECEKYGLLYKMDDIIRDYKGKYDKTQISWF
ncbi:radical SAM protein [Romboutsia sedimentorum]|uniref:SPL family radical SAM protein n=1 Tax=Romboutsia sedimentorum TaxID=1368474 RepID=UPI0024DE5B44|nr:radical SAM protein [Romboutsia sedimentorum]MDK2586047.1 radical SAM protein [Romboutsia sedimentorum]